MSNTIQSYNYLTSNNRITNSNIDSYTINTVDYTNLCDCLKSDMDGFFLNAILSYSSAIDGLMKKSFSWATIKLYYTLFYSLKAELSRNGFIIFYHNGKLFSGLNQVGEQFKPLKGTSHEAIFKLFSTKFPQNKFVINDIDNSKSFEWFKENREHVNYRINPMSDPQVSSLYLKPISNLRVWISNYIQDTNTNIYTFDNEHAYLAFTTQIIEDLFTEYSNINRKNLYLNECNFKYIKTNFTDKSGPISVLIHRLNQIKK
ncbi:MULTISPECIES: hypothetical protein [unclassified Arcicella]|uniref:hypothetical protein n=1 Tax=unclassified Arcicella TaxID=2644986 RepID=UPI00285D3373|nr:MULTISPECIES: hypothetical protein [unclassified Arcicella]MDR6563576.1 hypothetical protein [Arcicella sp. BE51]MDR6813312.1 hypothetical protein [Arcicella sp. BE140]MDR6824626.1 hypothetical protein [Arcicella sp. BE139]